MRVIKQSTYETCLASILLVLIKEGHTEKKEIDIWQHGWKFNYLIGQLNYVAKTYKQNFKVYVENRYYFIELQKIRDKRIKLENKKIDIRFINDLLKKGSAIVYLDNFYLQKIVHAPHFVFALSSGRNWVEIADPYDGKKKKVSTRTLNKAIVSLRNHLKFSPILIHLG